MRILKTAIAAALAVSMSVTPALAQSAMPLSIVASAGMMQDDDGVSNEGNQWLPALVIAGLLAAAILITTNDDNELNNPASP
jgi:glycerol uptake facilitator-like aquaporin